MLFRSVPCDVPPVGHGLIHGLLLVLAKLADEQAREQAFALLKRIGLEDKADVYSSQISGGQKQRIAIVRSLAMKRCSNCVDVCPGVKKDGVQHKALAMQPFESQERQAENWEYLTTKVKSKQHLIDVKANVKNTQFAQPLFEFSGASQ